MDKNYDHLKYEKDIYKKWEDSGAFKPQGESEPFTIIMPPPNANGELHLGHVTFVAVSDALIRYHRMKGEPTLWLPGIDHAGILTQVTFEKKLLKEENKSRYSLGREEFFKRCYDFAISNKSAMENQMRGLGSSCDWSREKFTLDPQISKQVFETFVKMHKEGLIYRGYRIVNWCPRCRSTLADVELEWQERTDPLYYIKYGPFVLATVRPETKFGDTALAVHPKDKRYTKYVGQEIEIEGLSGKFELKVITDAAVDMNFGTGVIKVTPGHDALDWEIGQRHKLEVKSVIDFDGKLTSIAGPYAGLKVAEARKKVAKDLQNRGLIEKIDEKYVHQVATCERCNTVIEPLISRQWFVSIKPLAQKAIAAVESGEVRIVPEKFEKMYFNWMRNIKDWPISRQIWWGHQLPVWYSRKQQATNEQKTEFEKLAKNDSGARTDVLESPIVSIDKPVGDDEYIQDPDTFDTWFSSGQWPFTTLRASQPGDFEKFYPTTVMNTAYEILFLWVARMIMFGIYLTGKAPFKVVLINGMLRDDKGLKMSKSKGNGVNPNEAINLHGADAIRMALLSGRDNGNDLAISKNQMEQRIRGYRNFANKIWNASRYVYDSASNPKSLNFAKASSDKQTPDPKDKEFGDKLNIIIRDVTTSFEKYDLGIAAEKVYTEFWHWYCDVCIEDNKKGELSSEALKEGLVIFLKLIHPFMPFVTEAVWQELGFPGQLILQSWPSPHLRE